MIDQARRKLMKYMAILGLGSVVGLAAPVKLSTKKCKTVALENRVNVSSGYYGFSETW